MSKWLLNGAFLVVGLLAGYAYWYFYGCVNGCNITGVWYNSTAYGGLMGYLAGGIVIDQVSKRKNAD